MTDALHEGSPSQPGRREARAAPGRGTGRPPRRGTRRDDAAGVGALVGFAVAVSVYALVFMVYLQAIQAPAGQEKVSPVLSSRAEAGLDQLLAGPGLTSTGLLWYKDPDRITRFGLAEAGKPGKLDLETLLNITKGNITKDPLNGLLDYEEARDALGLGDEYDFHLRTYPLLAPLDQAGLRPVKKSVAYLGDFSSTNLLANNYPVQNSTTLEGTSGSVVYVNVTVTNNGTTPSIFKVEFDVPLDDGTLEEDQYTPLLAASQSHKVTLKLHKQAGWSWAGSDKNVSIKIKDPIKDLGSIKVDLAGVDMTSPAYGGAGYAAVTVTPEKWSYKTNQFPKVAFEVWKKDGDTEFKPTVNITTRWAGNGTVVEHWQGQAGASNKHQLCCKLPADTYTVTIYRVGDAAFNSTETLVVTDGSDGEFTSAGVNIITESAASAYERGVVQSLVDGFANTTFDVGGGDVYRDFTTTMNNDLANNLSAGAFDILVVGSEVSHTAMTDNAARDAVRDFVKKGGLLVVMGSGNQDVAWLKPLFDATLLTSGNGIGVPDPSHPILHVPEELGHARYQDSGRTWQFATQADANHFTHVVLRLAGGTYKDSVLSVSKPGHFSNGTIVLTSWQLFNLTSPQDTLEAKKALYNFLSMSAGQLYVDFGPRLPDHAEVASSNRIATAQDPGSPGEQVLVRMVLYVFR